MDSADIKGDVCFPIIKVDEYGTLYDYTSRLLIYVRHTTTAANDDLMWMEAEDSDAAGLAAWSSQLTVSASGGEYMDSTDTQAWLFFKISNSIDMSYVGKLTPVVFAKGGIGADPVRMRVYFVRRLTGAGSFKAHTPWIDSITESSGFGSSVVFFKEVDFPLVPIQQQIDDSSVPDIGDYIGDIWFTVEMRKTSGGASTYGIDAVLLAHASDWICLLEAPSDGYWLRPWESPLHDRFLEVDSLSGAAFLRDEDDADARETVWEVHGMPVRDLILPADYDSVIRFVSLGYDARTELRVTVNGIFGTIFPFEEA